MKTIQEYLKECKEMACHNLLCYSKTYGMDTPKEGCELAFAGAQRDLEIVESLMKLTAIEDEGSSQTVGRHGVLINCRHMMHPDLLLYLGLTVTIRGTSVWYEDTHIHTF